jgi:hypothetical protein
MSTLYEGEPDVRQSEGTPAPSLFRKRYKQLSAEEVALHDAIKDKADELHELICRACAPCATYDLSAERARNQALAVQHLEDAVYRAVKALTT